MLIAVGTIVFLGREPQELKAIAHNKAKKSTDNKNLFHNIKKLRIVILLTFTAFQKLRVLFSEICTKKVDYTFLIHFLRYRQTPR